MRLPFPGGWRILFVYGAGFVRMRLIRQHGQWYAVGKDVGGVKRAGMGATRTAACDDLAGLLRAVAFQPAFARYRRGSMADNVARRADASSPSSVLGPVRARKTRPDQSRPSPSPEDS